MSEDSDLIKRQRQDFSDSQHELAGLEVGRATRFLPNGNVSSEEQRKKRDRERFQTRLMEFMNDPIYRAKYDVVLQTLQDSERATDAALTHLRSDIDAAQNVLADMDERAAHLPGGAAVFRDLNGQVRHADGSMVDDDLSATIIWTGNEPSFEDHQALEAHLADLKASLSDGEIYQNDVLGDARDKLTDPDSPPSLEGLEGILTNIESNVPLVVSAQIEMATPNQDVSLSVGQTALPKLGN